MMAAGTVATMISQPKRDSLEANGARAIKSLIIDLAIATKSLKK